MEEQQKMHCGRIKLTILSLAGFFVLIGIDQLTKKMAVTHLKGQPSVSVIKDIFVLQYLENQGAAFGILQGRRIAFLIITVVILCFLAYAFWRIPFQSRFLALHQIIVLIAAGAVGNFIDRMTNGYVVDFFYFKLINFPIFNVADIYVTCSAILLAVLLIFRYKDEDLNLLIRCLKNQNESIDITNEHK